MLTSSRSTRVKTFSTCSRFAAATTKSRLAAVGPARKSMTRSVLCRRFTRRQSETLSLWKRSSSTPLVAVVETFLAATTHPLALQNCNALRQPGRERQRFGRMEERVCRHPGGSGRGGGRPGRRPDRGGRDRRASPGSADRSGGHQDRSGVGCRSIGVGCRSIGTGRRSLGTRAHRSGIGPARSARHADQPEPTILDRGGAPIDRSGLPMDREQGRSVRLRSAMIWA